MTIPIDDEDRELHGFQADELLTHAECLEIIEFAHDMAMNDYDFDPYFDDDSRCPNCGVPGEEFESGLICEDCGIKWDEIDVS